MTNRSVKNKFMSPRTKQANEKIKEKRQEQIIITALENFANRGYHRTSISDIAKAAGISKGLMYNYFDSKEDLLIAVLEYVLPQAVDAIFTGIAKQSKTLKPRELIVYGIERFFEMMQEQADLWKFSMSLSLQVSDMPKIHKVIVQMFDTMHHKIEELLNLNNIPDASVKARLIAAQLDGIALHYFVLGRNYDLAVVKKAFIQDVIS